MSDNRLNEIKGHAKDGRFYVTEWPKPRLSNPHFLTDMLEDFERAARAKSDAATPTEPSAISRHDGQTAQGRT
jgi:hypothetical protein